MEYNIGDKIEIIIGRFTDIGIRVYVRDNEDIEGMLYRNEVFKKVREGQKTAAFVKKVREDGLIDFSLQPIGFVDAIEVDKNKVLTHLEQEGGFLPLNDKSDPEDIKYHLQMSKKAFKKAVGALYKERIIEISEKGIDLI
jgi:hypothetical protein